MRRGNHILELLTGEDVDRGEIAFSVAVLSSLGDRDVQDLAGLSFNHDVSVKREIVHEMLSAETLMKVHEKGIQK